MGSGDWFKNIINKKKAKGGTSKKPKRHSAPGNFSNGDRPLESRHSFLGNVSSVEDAAATRIQAAFRAHLARKKLRYLKGVARLQNRVQIASVKKQASTTLSLLHSWSMVQAQIRARRANMVTVGRLRQKKLENDLKLEAKLHGLESEWSGGSETIDEALARIHQREEAAVRRERAMAYAFTHQWRASSSPSFGSGNQDLSSANWGWSWIDNWVAARPWEGRAPAPKKTTTRQPNKSAPDKGKLISPTTAKQRKPAEKKVGASNAAAGPI